MALGATIYKVELHVADTDRHYYGSHQLTIARHPSETAQRMMVRLLAFALNAEDELAFTKGISDADEPAIWLKDLTGSIKLWVEVGQPADVRLLKACGRADQVVVYCFGGHASKVWWDSVGNKVKRARNLTVINLPAHTITALAKEVARNMVMHVNIQEREVFVPTPDGQLLIVPEVWSPAQPY